MTERREVKITLGSSIFLILYLCLAFVLGYIQYDSIRGGIVMLGFVLVLIITALLFAIPFAGIPIFFWIWFAYIQPWYFSMAKIEGSFLTFLLSIPIFALGILVTIVLSVVILYALVS